MFSNRTSINRRRNAIWFSTVSVIFIIVGMVVNYFYPQADPESNLYIWAYASYSLALLIFLYSLSCAIQERFYASTSTLVVGVFVSLLFEPLIHDGFGIVWGVIFIPIAWLYANVTQERKEYISKITLLATLLFSILIVMDVALTPQDTVAPAQIGNFDYLDVYITVTFSVVIATLAWISFANFRTFSLQTKFILATTILAVTGILVTTFAVTNTISQIITEDIEQDLKNLSQFRASTLGAILSQQTLTHEALKTNRELIVAIIQSNQALDRLSTNELRQELASLQEVWENTPPSNRSAFINTNILVDISLFQSSFTDHRNVILTNKYGVIVSSSDPQDDFDVSGRTWWQGAYWGSKGRIYIGNPIVSEQDNTIHIPLATPIYPTTIFPGQEPIGILYTEYDFTESLALITDQTNTEQQVSLIIDNFIAETNAGDLSYYAVPLTASDANNLVDTGFSTALYKSERRLLGYQQVVATESEIEINELNWGVLVSQSLGAVQDVVRSQQTAQAALGIGIVIVGVLLAFWVARLVSGPIIRLAEVANRLASGEMSVRAPIETGDEIAALAKTINQLADNTEENIRTLQSRVNDRTQALETSFRISRTLSTILDRRDLADEIVNQLQVAFNFYHVHVYFFDEAENILRLVSGSGRVGEQLLEKGHSITLDKGIVGAAAQTNTTVFVPDVRRNKSWIPNELLPDTTAEIAVPIAIADTVLGIIDVQENQPNKLGPQDTGLLEAIAAQTAIALRNAQFYENAQQKAARETLINEIKDKIQRTSNVESALKTAVRELGSALQSKQTIVNVKNKANQTSITKGHVGD